MALGLGFQGGVVGIGVEDTYGTAITRTIFVELNSDGLKKDIEQMHSAAIPGIYRDDDDFAQGSITVGGDIEFEMRYQGMETLIKHAMGSCATAETASFAVTSANKYFDFKEDAGGALLGTVEEGSYPIGASSAVSGSLCEAIKTALEANGAGTYTVSYSTTTQFVTIAVATGASAVQFLWKTGTHGSDNTDDHIGTLLGFADTADGSSVASDAGTVQVQPVYTHTFTLADALPTGLTLEVDRDVSAFAYEGCKITTMEMSVENNGFLNCKMGIIGEDGNTGTATSATLPTSELVLFASGAITWGGSTTSVKSANFVLDNKLSSDRRYLGSQLISEPQRTEKIDVTGTMVIDFDSTTKYDDFVAATERAVTLTFTSAALIKTGFYYTITITFPIVKLTASAPMVTDAGALQLELPFRAYASDSSTREFNIAIVNALATVA